MERFQAAIDKSEREALIAFREMGSSLPPPAGDTRWTNLPRMNLNRKRLAQNRIVTIDQTDSAHLTFNIMRTKILKILRENNWTSVAITSPTPGCGKTMVGLNLAFSLANLKDSRTVLVDLNLRRPEIGNILGLDKVYSMERFLTGASSIEETFVRCGDNLAVGANFYPVPQAAELLHSPDTTSILSDMKDRLKPDVVLFDLPPMLVNDDVLAFLPNVDCVILVVAAESSTVGEVDICERNLAEASHVLGVVLNKCEHGPDRYGY